MLSIKLGLIAVEKSKIYVFMVVIFLMMYGHKVNAKTDYCSSSKNTLVFLIDQTTKYDAHDKQILKQGIERFISTLSTNDRLVVHPITDGASSGKKIFDKCYPGCPDHISSNFFDSFLNLFGVGKTCSEVIAKRDRILFRKKLSSSLKPIIYDITTYKHSAITQTIAVKARSYINDNNFSKLIIYSDLLENSPELPWPLIVKNNNPKLLYSRIRIDQKSRPLKNVDVSVFGFGRIHNTNRRSLTNSEYQSLQIFWGIYFKGEGAKSTFISQDYEHTKLKESNNDN